MPSLTIGFIAIFGFILALINSLALFIGWRRARKRAEKENLERRLGI